MTNKRIFGMVIGEMGVYILCSAIWLGFPATGFAGECPQDRKTITAPQEFLNMQNPLAPDERTLKAGENLFQNEARPIACKFCHGVKGDGKSGPDFESTPPAQELHLCRNHEKITGWSVVLDHQKRVKKHLHVCFFGFDE